MVQRVQTLRSTVTGARPSGRAPGELYVNFPDKQIGVADMGGTPQDLIPIRYFSPSANYAMRDLVMYDGRIYRSVVAVTAGPWNLTQWTPITSASIVSTGVALFEQTRDYKQNDVVVHDGKLYRANSAVAAAAWNGTNWTQISDYTLPAATAAALGGVKATAPVTGQFVTGINATGDLTFAAIPIATAAAIGGVKATAPVKDQFVTGINASGDLTFAAPTAYTLPAATSAALGGIKLVATPPAGQFINGFAADGTATYAAVTGFAKLDADQEWTAQQHYKVTALTYAATVAWDCSPAQKASLDLTGNATMAKPTNAKAGATYYLWVKGTGTFTLSFDATGYDFGTAGAPTLSGGGKRDLLMFEAHTDDGKLCFLGAAKGFA